MFLEIVYSKIQIFTHTSRFTPLPNLYGQLLFTFILNIVSLSVSLTVTTEVVCLGIHIDNPVTHSAQQNTESRKTKVPREISITSDIT